jgi:hypothetical protein
MCNSIDAQKCGTIHTKINDDLASWRSVISGRELFWRGEYYYQTFEGKLLGNLYEIQGMQMNGEVHVYHTLLPKNLSRK